MGNKHKRQSKTVSSSICRVHKNKDFTILSNSFLRSPNLSLASIGLMGRVMSLPDEWDYSVKGLTAICKEGITAIETVLKELQEWEYLKKTKYYPNETDDGRIHHVYDFYESSEKDKTIPFAVIAESDLPANKSKRCRVNKTGNFTIVSSKLLRSTAISLKALGLLLRVLSLPDEWDYSVSGLVAICKEGKTAVDSALKELKSERYLIVTKLYANMTESRNIEYVYDFFEEAVSKEDAEKHMEQVKVEAIAKASGVSTKMLKNSDISAPQEGEKQGVENLCLDTLPTDSLPTEKHPQYNTKEQNKENKILIDEGSINQSPIQSQKPVENVESSSDGSIDGYITDKEKIKTILKENIEYANYVDWIRLFAKDMTVREFDQLITKLVKAATCGHGRIIGDETFTKYEVQEAILNLNEECIDRAYEVLREKAPNKIKNRTGYLVSVLIQLGSECDIVINSENRSIEFDVQHNICGYDD